MACKSNFLKMLDGLLCYMVTCCLIKEAAMGNVPVPEKMPRKDPARRAAAILEEHFATLSESAEAKARKELRKLASVVSRRAHGKVSKSPQNVARPRSTRSRASTA